MIRKQLARLLGGRQNTGPRAQDEFDVRRLPGILGKPDPTILEIGCNGGSDTLSFLQLFPSARVFAFEPDPRAAARFRQTVSDSRVTLFEIAISNADGPLEFHMSGGAPVQGFDERWPDDWDLSGSLRKPTEHLKVHPWCKFDEVIEVQSSRLDTWAKSNSVDAVDFIWMDVQGAESDVIAGAQQTLGKTRYLYSEYSERELYAGQVNLRGLIELLPSFELVEVFANDALLRNRKLESGA